MGTISKGYTFSPTEQVTDAKLHTMVDGASVTNIVNADIANGAAISEAKLALDGSQIVDLTSTQTISGDKTFSGTVNLVNNDGSVNPTNLLSNGDFESWSAGTSAAPDGWTLAGASATIAQGSSTPDPKIGTYYVELTRAGTNCEIYQQIQTNKGLAYWKGRTITFSCWVKASVASRAFLRIADGVDTSASSYHTGSDTWELLTVTRTISASAVIVQLDCFIVAGDTSAYFDGAMCVEGSSAFAFANKPAGEGVWADYSATSTIVGWSSFVAKKIYTKKIGKTVFVNFLIQGTSNATSSSCTLPYVSEAYPNYVEGYIRAKNEGKNIFDGTFSLAGGESTLKFLDTWLETGWTNSGTKLVSGQFLYESA